MVKIECGKIMDALKSVLRLIDKGLDSLSRLGMEVKDKTTLDDGSVVYTVYAGDNDSIVFKVRVSESANPSLVDVECKDDKQNKHASYEEVYPDKIYDAVEKFCKDSYGSDCFVMEEDVSSSFHFQVGLKRVVGGREDSVQLTSICCNHNIQCADMLQDIEDMLTDSNVLECLPENQVACFDVCHGDDCIGVESVESCNPTDNPYLLALRACYVAMNACTAIDLNARGAQARQLSDDCGYIYTSLYSFSIQLGDMCAKEFGSVPSPLSIMLSSECQDVYTDNGFTFADGVAVLTDHLKEFLTSLELIYCEVSHDVKAQIDSWIGFLNRVIYFRFSRTAR